MILCLSLWSRVWVAVWPYNVSAQFYMQGRASWGIFVTVCRCSGQESVIKLLKLHELKSFRWKLFQKKKTSVYLANQNHYQRHPSELLLTDDGRQTLLILLWICFVIHQGIIIMGNARQGHYIQGWKNGLNTVVVVVQEALEIHSCIFSSNQTG